MTIIDVESENRSEFVRKLKKKEDLKSENLFQKKKLLTVNCLQHLIM